MHFFLIFIAGFSLGFVLKSRPNDIDLHKENLKLRKENEVLWARLKDEGKIDKF